MSNVELPIFYESNDLKHHIEFLEREYYKVKTEDENDTRIVAIFPGGILTDPIYCVEIANSFLNNARILLEQKKNNEYKTTW